MVERLQGAINQQLRKARGRTGRSAADRGDYPAEARACLTHEQIEKAVAITAFRICNGEMDEKTRKRPDLEWIRYASRIPDHLLNVDWEAVQLAFLPEQTCRLSGKGSTGAKDFHTLLRVMGQRWDLSPVLIGDRSLAEVIYADGELSTRLASCPLRRWEYGQDYARLLNSLVYELPLRRESELTEEPLAKSIFQTSEGLIGEIVQTVTTAAMAAVRNGDERITLALFKAITFTPPSKRFSTAELRGLS